MNDAERMAGLLLAAHAGGALVDARAGNAPASVEVACAVQDLVLRGLSGGQRAGLWKAIAPPPGGEPRASPVPPARVFASPARLAVPRALVGVEAEVAFRLGADLQPEEALVLIELCGTRLADWPNAPALWKLADFQSNAACIAGGGTRAWRSVDFGAQRVELSINGAPVASAVGSHPAGDPLRLVPAAAKRARLQAGDIVTTGSWVGLVKTKAGDEIVARFPGIGEARLALISP